MVGIDFGTSNTVVSVVDSGGARLVRLSSESFSLPTLLSVDQKHQIRIGHDARRAYGEALAQGTVAASPVRLFQAVKLALKDPDIKTTNLFGTQVRIEKIVSWYLAALRQRILEVEPGWDGRAVIGRPSDLSGDRGTDSEIQGRFEEAFRMAGFEEIHFVHEPVAAAADLVGQVQGKVLVFDFGGGTLDISVAELTQTQVRILASVGLELGGYLLDEDIARERIQGHFGHKGRLVTLTGQVLEVPHEVTGQVVRFKVLPFDEIRRIKRLIPELIVEAVDKPKLRGLLGFLEKNLTYELYQAIDGAKVRLSSEPSAEVSFSVPPHVSFRERIFREEFEAVIAPRVIEAEALIERALSLAGCSAVDIDQVIRVGGSSQVPTFVRLLEHLFPGRLSVGNLFDGIALGLVPAYKRGLGVPPAGAT